MTIEACKKNLLQAIDDKANRTIALSGNWGTGKTYLWRQVKMESPESSIELAASVSLFGISSLYDLKMKVAQALLPSLKSDSALKAQVAAALSGFKKIAKSIHSGFGALDELALIAIPSMLKDKFLIIDDIERKHDKLSIDEVLGFIDECVQSYNCRVILVLNDDKLTDKNVWEQFREKVIDQELRLETSPEEAFGIAKTIVSTKWPMELGVATLSCGITNIRIICKIIRVANRLLDGHGALSKNVIERVVPSIVLLSAIYYKGLKNGPTFDYVVDHNAIISATSRAIRRQAKDERGEEDALHGQWDLLLADLGISNTGEFERLVVKVLQTGLLDTQEINDLIERYQLDGQILGVRSDVSAFIQNYQWHPEISEEQLADEMRELVAGAEYIETPTLSYLIDVADEITGDSLLGQQFIKSWSNAFEKAYPNGLQRPEWEPPQPIHKEIIAVLDGAYSRHSSVITLVQACHHIRSCRGWGSAEEHLLKTISEADYEAEIRSAKGNDLEGLLHQSMQFVIHKTAYEPHFGDVAERFIAACKKIVRTEPDSRLTKIIQSFFKARGQEVQL